MNKEQYSKGVIIRKEINQLEKDINEIKSRCYNDSGFISWMNLRLYISGQDNIYLTQKLLPINVKLFTEQYLQNLEERIITLEKEFSQL